MQIPLFPVRLSLLLYTLLIVYLSTQSVGAPPLFENSDKVAHFLAYGGLSVLIFLAYSYQRTRIMGLILAFLLGLAMEWVQSRLPHREMSYADAVANTLGLLAGAFFCIVSCRLVYRWRARK